MFCVEASNARQFTTTRHLQPCRPITPTMTSSLQLAVQTLSNPTTTHHHERLRNRRWLWRRQFGTHLQHKLPTSERTRTMGRQNKSPPDAAIGLGKATRLHEANTTINQEGGKGSRGVGNVINTPQTTGMWGIMAKSTTIIHVHYM